MSELLELQGVEVELEDGSLVVRGVSLALGEGEAIGVVGESGSGKTMLALSLIGLLPEGSHARGRAVFGDDDLFSLSSEAIRRLRGDRIAMIFQDPLRAFNPTMKLGRQVTESYVVHRGVSARRAVAYAPRMLRDVGVSDPMLRAKQRPYEMSGGMLQRAMIASAVALEPDLLIADEPTTGLDVTIQAGILQEITRLRLETGMGVVLISHDLAVIAGHCDHVAVMYAGELVEIGPARDVLNEPKHPYTKALLAATPDPWRKADWKPIAGLMPSPKDERIGCSFIPRCQYAEAGCEDEQLLATLDVSRVRCWKAERL